MIWNWEKNISKTQLKLFFWDSDSINEHQYFPEDETDHSGDDCIENHINYIIQNKQPLDKKLVENRQNNQIPDETPAIAIKGWDKLPDEIDEKILIQAIKSYNDVCETYKIKNSCSRFQIIGKKGKMLLPCIYIKPDDNIKKSFNGKIKFSVRKLLKPFGQGSALIMYGSQLVGNKNWKSVWLISLPARNVVHHSENLLAKTTRKKERIPS